MKSNEVYSIKIHDILESFVTACNSIVNKHAYTAKIVSLLSQHNQYTVTHLCDYHSYTLNYAKLGYKSNTDLCNSSSQILYMVLTRVCKRQDPQ